MQLIGNFCDFGIALLIAACFYFSLSLGWRIVCLPLRASQAGTIAAKPDEAVVFGGRRLAGFLVLPDEMPLRKEIPSFHLSEFEAIVKQSNVETYQGLIHPEMPPLPFGFVFSPRLEKDGAEHLSIHRATRGDGTPGCAGLAIAREEMAARIGGDWWA